MARNRQWRMRGSVAWPWITAFLLAIAPRLAAAEALHDAASKGDVERVRQLLASGADVNAATEDHSTPLLIAISEQHQAVTELLIAAGANVNAANDQGDTPLLVAVRQDNTPLVTILLAKGAQVNRADKSGVTPLRAAIEVPNTATAELLVEEGAVVELPEADGTPPLVATIDVVGTLPSHARRAVERRPDLRGIALDAPHRKLYWTDYGRGRIRGANLDGSGLEDVLAVDGPVGIAVDASSSMLYWTTDGPYPRALQRMALTRKRPETLRSGRFLNRPAAMALDPQADRVYWAESVAGRIRRAHCDGSKLEDLLTSGLGVTDRPGNEVTSVWGIALESSAGKIYWTEPTTSKIKRANLDGSQEEDVVGASASLDFPAGIAIDGTHRKVYWTDRGTAKIQRANLDGSAVEDLVGRANGIVDPRAIAVDVDGGKLYWIDSATAKIQRANLDGSMLEDLVRVDGSGRVAPRGNPSVCEQAIAQSADLFVTQTVTAIAVCLDKVGAIKAVKDTEDAASKAVATCVGQLRHLHDSRVPSQAFEDELRSAISRTCPPQVAVKPETIESYRARAYATVAAAYPRAIEWLEEVRPFVVVQASPPTDPTRVRDALQALDALQAALEKEDATAGNAAGQRPRVLPASGQAATYMAVTKGTGKHMGAVPDDGALRAGEVLRYRDGGDGTITDPSTGLVWEKKCDCPGSLHDYRPELRWSATGDDRTIWDWLDDVNREGGSGFAGHHDWRIPNVKELQSIVDYQRFNPATTPTFDGAACGLGCPDLADPACSCTSMNSYWSSTTYADSPEAAWAVGFNLGLIGDMPKAEDLPVRAVRGGR
jgi:sugar lactone lactonase YvrE